VRSPPINRQKWRLIASPNPVPAIHERVADDVADAGEVADQTVRQLLGERGRVPVRSAGLAREAPWTAAVQLPLI